MRKVSEGFEQWLWDWKTFLSSEWKADELFFLKHIFFISGLSLYLSQGICLKKRVREHQTMQSINPSENRLRKSLARFLGKNLPSLPFTRSPFLSIETHGWWWLRIVVSAWAFLWRRLAWRVFKEKFWNLIFSVEVAEKEQLFALLKLVKQTIETKE